MPRYRGAIESHSAVKSSKQGTPGIKFVITLREILRGQNYEEIQWKEIEASIWFPPGGDPSWNLKKLAFAGYEGGGLKSMNLSGNTVEVVSEFETWNGKQREKYELALPPMDDGPSDEAFLAIDAILSTATVPSVSRPEPVASTPSRSSSGPEPEPSNFDDDDVPF